MFNGIISFIKDFFIPQAVNCKDLRPLTGWEANQEMIITVLVYLTVGILFDISCRVISRFSGR